MPINAALIPLLTALVQLAASVAPELIKDFKLLVDLLTSGKDPTPEEQAQIDAALEQAHNALQAHISAKLNPTHASSDPANS